MEIGEVGGVTVAVGGVGFSAGVGDFGAAGGLGVLPCGYVRGSGGGDVGRVEGAAVGGWAGVLVDEEGYGVEVLGGDLFADVLGGGDGLARGVGDGLAADVGSGEEGRAGDGFGPGEEIGGLCGFEATAFLLVEEEDGAGGEVLALGGGYRGGCVFLAEGGGGGSGLLGLVDLDFETAVVEDEEAEVVAEEDVALASPCVLTLAGWVAEPVAGEGEVLAEGGKSGVAGVVVAVEPDVAVVE